MDSVIEGLKYIYRYSRLFILMQKLQLLTKNNLFIYNIIMSRLLVISDIDSYSISADSIHFCPTYYKLILRGNKPKFGILNNLLHIEY